MQEQVTTIKRGCSTTITIAVPVFQHELLSGPDRHPFFSPIHHARCWLGLALPKLQLLQRKRVRIEGPFLDCMLLIVI